MPIYAWSGESSLLQGLPHSIRAGVTGANNSKPAVRKLDGSLPQFLRPDRTQGHHFLLSRPFVQDLDALQTRFCQVRAICPVSSLHRKGCLGQQTSALCLCACKYRRKDKVFLFWSQSWCSDAGGGWSVQTERAARSVDHSTNETAIWRNLCAQQGLITHAPHFQGQKAEGPYR